MENQRLAHNIFTLAHNITKEGDVKHSKTASSHFQGAKEATEIISKIQSRNSTICGVGALEYLSDLKALLIEKKDPKEMQVKKLIDLLRETRQLAFSLNIELYKQYRKELYQ